MFTVMCINKIYTMDWIHRVSKKLCIFVSELRQISTNFNNFWYTDG